MKKAFLLLTLAFVIMGAQAQTGARVITDPQNGRTYEFGKNITNQKAVGEVTGDAEVVWHLNETYAIGAEAFVGNDINGVRTLSVNWTLNDQRIDGYKNEDQNAVWQVETTYDFTSYFSSKNGELNLIIDQPNAYVVDGNGVTVNTLEIGENGAFGAVRPDGTGYYIGVRDGNGKTDVSYYSGADTFEWTQSVAGSVVSMTVAEDNSRILVGMAQPEKVIYVLNSEGDVLQDDIYYYNNSPTQSPAISANGDYLAYADFSGNGTLMKWNGERYENVWKVSIGCAGESSTWGAGQAISPDGKYVAFGTLGFVSSGYDGAIFLFNNYSSTPEWVYTNCGDEVQYISFNEDGSLFACAGMGPMDHSTADLLVFRPQSIIPYMELNTPGSLTACTFSPDGKYVITAGKAVHDREMGWGGNAYLIKTETATVGILDGTINVGDAVVTVNGLDNYYVRSNEDGTFSMRYIPEGTYTVTVSKTGYTTVTLENVVISGGETTTIDANLESVGEPLTGLYATQGASATGVGLVWDAYEGEGLSGYVIYRKDAAEAPYGNPIAICEENEYIDVTAIPTHNYFYAVTAVIDEELETPYSEDAEGWASAAFIVETAEAYVGAAPTIDGVKDAEEWNDAFVFDISDFLGSNNNIEPAGSVLAYMKTDGNKMYFAVEVFTDTILNSGDCVAMYWDDNGDGMYPVKDEANLDNSEGNYWMKYTGDGATSMTYRPIYKGGGVGTTGDVPEAELVFGDAEGHVFVEFALVIGEETYDLTPVDNMSTMYMYYRSEGSDYHAYWPYNNTDTFDPVGYNTVIYNVEHVAPAAPTNLRAEAVSSDNYVAVYWDAPASNDIDHYIVYVNDEEGVECEGTTYMFQKEVATVYEIYVIAVDHSGLESPKSETLTFGTSVNENNAQQFVIYPNPAKGQVIISGENINTVEIFNMTGQIVRRFNVHNDSLVISTENLGSGMYFVTINGKSTQKLIVR